jgi:hypothetical protein
MPASAVPASAVPASAVPASAVPGFKCDPVRGSPPEPPEDVVLHRVAPLSEAAVHKQIAFGLPVFCSVAALRGIALDD